MELFAVETGRAYVKGLMAVNRSKVYTIHPFTSIDAEKAGKANFPEDRMARVRARVLPTVLRDIKGKTILDIDSGFGSLTLEMQKTTRTQRFTVSISTNPLSAWHK